MFLHKVAENGRNETENNLHFLPEMHDSRASFLFAAADHSRLVLVLHSGAWQKISRQQRREGSFEFPNPAVNSHPSHCALFLALITICVSQCLAPEKEPRGRIQLYVQLAESFCSQVWSFCRNRKDEGCCFPLYKTHSSFTLNKFEEDCWRQILGIINWNFVFKNETKSGTRKHNVISFMQNGLVYRLYSPLQQTAVDSLVQISSSKTSTH